MDAGSRLEDAVRSGDVRRVRHALASGADANHRCVTGAGNGQEALSLLGLAAAAGHEAIVRALLDAGARPWAERGVTSTALHEAAGRGDTQILELLLSAGGRRAINRLDASGFTPLMRAVEAGHLKAATVLLEAGADPNAGPDEPMRESAIRIAAASGTYDMAKLLLDADADPLVPGRLMLTALDRARERRTPDGRRITALILRTLEERAAATRAPARPSASHKPMSRRK